MEVWRDVKGYEGLYLVSNLGRIKNVLYRHSSKIKGKQGKLVARDKLLKPFHTHKGYLLIDLSDLNNIKKTYSMHRLVLEAFTECTPNLFVNHINGIKDDNRLENLEWVTASENTRHAIRTGLFKPGKHLPKRPGKEVQALKYGVIVDTYPSIREMCRTLNLNNGDVTISIKRNNGNQKVKGYSFRLTGRITLKGDKSDG
jgi:hypothetical protein